MLLFKKQIHLILCLCFVFILPPYSLSPKEDQKLNKFNTDNTGNNNFGETYNIDEYTPNKISDSLKCIYSILPQIPIGKSDGKGFETRGLKPATAFLLKNNRLITAGHSSQQSEIAFARSIVFEGVFIDKYQCYRNELIETDRSVVEISNFSNETGQLINKLIVEWDVGIYKLSHDKKLPFLKKISSLPKIEQDVSLLGVPFDAKLQSYSVKYSIGKIRKIIRSTGTAFMYLIDAKSEEGWSGGPVIDLSTGEVIGVISGHYSFPPHDYTLAWSVP